MIVAGAPINLRIKIGMSTLIEIVKILKRERSYGVLLKKHHTERYEEEYMENISFVIFFNCGIYA